MTSAPKAIQTNGIGKRITSHLNLTRTLADAPIVEPRHANQFPRTRRNGNKLPYAGSGQ